MGHIFFIGGISGAGKGTLINNLKNTQDDLHFPLSYKTRPIRETETNGVDAYFISSEEFYNQVQTGEFLEYAVVHGRDYYGTKFEDVLEKGLDLGKTVIKEIDVIGLEKLKQTHPQLDEKYTTIFLNIPLDLIKERIEKRGALMSNEELQDRINSATIETTKSKELFDHIIDSTQDPEKVMNDVLEIIRSK